MGLLELQERAVAHVKPTATAIFSKALRWLHAVSDPDYMDGTGKKKKKKRTEEKTAAVERRAAILAFDL